MMKRLLLAVSLLTGTPLEAQSPEILVEALKFARAELARQGVGPDEEVVFDTGVAHSRWDPPTSRAPWSDAQLEMLRSSTGMKPGALESVRTCTTLRSGTLSCTLRPTRAVVFATRPQVNGAVASVLVLMRFQPRTLKYSPTTNEPFEIHFLQNIHIELMREGNGWTVTDHTMGPPGVSVDW